MIGWNYSSTEQKELIAFSQSYSHCSAPTVIWLKFGHWQLACIYDCPLAASPSLYLPSPFMSFWLTSTSPVALCCLLMPSLALCMRLFTSLCMAVSSRVLWKMTSYSQQLSHEEPAWAHLVSSRNKKTDGEGEHRAAGVLECKVVRATGIRLGYPSFAVGIAVGITPFPGVAATSYPVMLLGWSGCGL